MHDHASVQRADHFGRADRCDQSAAHLVSFGKSGELAKPYAVGITVDHFDLFVQRRPRRQHTNICQRLHDHFRRRLNDKFS